MTVYDYDDYNYAARSLNGGVVKTADGKSLMYVDNIDRTFSVRCRPVTFEGLGPARNVPFKDLDVRPIPLGFTQAQLSVAFLSRQPRRQWLQSTGQVKIKSTTRVRTDGYVHLLQPALNIYPKLEEAVKMLNAVFREVALSRDFSLTDTFWFKYRSSEFFVGQFDPVKYSVRIQPEMRFASELLLETFPEIRIED